MGSFYRCTTHDHFHAYCKVWIFRIEISCFILATVAPKKLQTRVRGLSRHDFIPRSFVVLVVNFAYFIVTENSKIDANILDCYRNAK